MFFEKYVKKYQLLPLEIVSTLLKYCNNLKYEKARIGKGDISEEIRKTEKYHINPNSPSLTDCHWARYLNFKITTAMNMYAESTKLKKYIFPVNQLVQLDALKYNIGYHYDFHVDYGLYAQNRMFSAILFLNNDYEGGELCFKTSLEDEEFEVKSSPGALVIWPSAILFPHSVKPVKKGTRYTIVAWA